MLYYHSLEVLSLRLNDTINVYVMPFINIYTLICNLITAVIFSNKKLKGDIYRYILAQAISSSIYFTMSNSLSITRCGALCPWGYDYYSKLFELYIYLYLGKIIEFFHYLVDLTMCIVKLRSFSVERRRSSNTQANSNSNRNFYIMIFIFIISSFVYNILPSFYGRSIIQIGYLVSNKTINKNLTETVIERPLFTVYRDNSINNFYNTLVQIIFSVLIFILLLLAIMIINILITFKLKKFLAIKARVSSKNIIFYYN